MAWTRTFRRRLAITGLGGAGKTVFLTSLINHLQNHDPERFDLGETRKNGRGMVRQFKHLPAHDGNDFPYQNHRRRMGTDNAWPEKTANWSRYRCRFALDSWRFGDVLLELHDFPGERFLDAAMDGRNYRKWSTEVLEKMADDGEQEIRPYLDLLERQSPLDESEIILEYKRLLVRLARRYRSLITPSTFLLDREGQVPYTSQNDEEIAASRYVGVDKESEFAPLDKSTIGRNPELVARFEERYRRYQRAVVAPMYKALRRFDGLLVLADVADLLQAGPARLNDHRAILDHLFKSLKPGGGIPWRLSKGSWDLCAPHQFRLGGIQRISFIASQEDKVPAGDKDNLEKLLKELVREYAQKMIGVDVKYFKAAGVVSLEPCGSADHALQGRLIYDNQGNKRAPTDPKIGFKIPKPVPETWPEDWEPGEYHFPNAYPKFPKPEFMPPAHSDLDAILAFHLG